MSNSFQIRKILLPTDFSSNSDNSISYAASLATYLEAEVVVYHAYPIPIVDVNMPASVFLQVTQEAESNARQLLEKTCLELKSRLPENSSCSYILAQDFSSAKVVETSNENNVDLIIMATHGINGIAELILGTNTARVVDKASCPVLAIPENIAFKPITKILFTTDYHDTDFFTLKKIIPLANLFNAEIIVMHVFQHDRKLESNMLEWFKEEVENHVTYEKMLYVLEENENVTEAINKYIDENNVSILVASSKKRNMIEKIFHNSITKKLTYHPHVPFLVFHYTKEDENKVETT